MGSGTYIALGEGCVIDGQLGEPAIETAPWRPVSAVAQCDRPIRIDGPAPIDLRQLTRHVKS